MIAHHAALEYRRRTGHVGDALGNESAGAALRRAQGEAPVPQSVQRHLGQPGHVRAVHQLPQQSAHLPLHRGDEGVRFLRRGGLGGDAQLHLSLLGVGGQGGIFQLVHPLPQEGLHRRLPRAEHTQGAGANHLLAQPGQPGQRPLPEHGQALAGRAGEHHHIGPLHLKGAARRGAPGVVQHMAALGQPRLLKIVFRHLPAYAGKKTPNVLGALRVEHQLFPKGLRQRLLGEVVAGGPQSPRSHQYVRPAPGQLRRRLHALRVIPHHRVVQHIQPQAGQLPAQGLGVGIDDSAQQQLSTHRQNFHRMAHGLRLRFQFYFILPVEGCQAESVPPPFDTQLKI